MPSPAPEKQGGQIAPPNAPIPPRSMELPGPPPGPAVTGAIRTPLDDLPAEIRRTYWGWFGEPWPSGICYGDDGRLLEEMRKPFPAGEKCLYCEELFDEAAGDSGQAMPLGRGDGLAVVVHLHKECLLRQVTGSVACLEGHHRHETGLSSRKEALAAWAWVQKHGTGAPRGYGAAHQAEHARLAEVQITEGTHLP